jgi:hypothetical protein
MTSGTILIERDALHPRCFELKDDSLPNGWMAATHDLSPHGLEKELSNTGWTLFYMASGVRTTAFGLDRARSIHTALQRLVTNARLHKCNCLEIDDVATHSFLGMPYVSVSAHERHIQKGMVFSGQ